MRGSLFDQGSPSQEVAAPGPDDLCHLHRMQHSQDGLCGTRRASDSDSLAEPHGRFTLDFEAFAIQLILACQNLTEVGGLLGISWNGIQAIQRRGVERGLLRRKRETIGQLGIDEKSFLSRHRYATVLSDLKGAGFWKSPRVVMRLRPKLRLMCWTRNKRPM